MVVEVLMVVHAAFDLVGGNQRHSRNASLVLFMNDDSFALLEHGNRDFGSGLLFPVVP